MNMRDSRWHLSVAVGALVACSGISTSAFAQNTAPPPQPADAAAATDPASTVETGGVGDIVVTATRRSESANKIPLAITAMSGDMLRNQHVASLEDMVAQMSNVRSASRGPGASAVFIRGLSSDMAGSQFQGTVGVQPNVALYLNDAPSSMPGRNLDIYAVDLSRVEVLAGPQGTLFGASSMGGAIRYITNKPNLDKWEAGINATFSATVSAATSQSGDFYINAPIVPGKLALRLVGYIDNQGGYIDNVQGTYQMPFEGNVGVSGALPTGNPMLVMRALQTCIGVSNCTGSGYTAPTRATLSNEPYVKNNFNTAKYQGFRAALTWQPTPDWSFDLLHMRQQLNTEGVFSYEPEVGDLQVQSYSPNSLDDKFDVTSWTANGRLGALSVLYTGSYVHHEAVQRSDYTNYASVGKYISYYQCDAGVYYNNPAKGSKCYNPTNYYTTRTINRRLTNELRVVTPAEKRIRATVGVFYDVNTLEDNTDWFYASPQAGFNTRMAVNPSVSANDYSVKGLGDGFFNDTRRTDKQFAVYGEASFDIIPKRLTITGGARYYHEVMSMTGSSDGSWGLRSAYDVATGTYAASNGQSYYNVSANLANTLAGLSPATFQGVIPKGNITYKFQDGSLVYATYSQGYRPGGFNRKPCTTDTPYCRSLRFYSPDNVKNYEIGGKIAALGHKLQINASAYIVRWTDIQMTVFDTNISNQAFTNNLADARIHGIEGDITWRATHDLTFNTSISYNDTKLTGYKKQISVLVPIGSPLAQSPRFQFTLGARYEKPLSNGITPYFAVNMHHVSSSISSDIANTSLRYTGQAVTYNGVTVEPGDTISSWINAVSQRGYDMFDASAGLRMDKWTFEIFGKNLGNARPQLFSSTSDGSLRVTTSRPLTVGLRISAAY